MTWLLHVLVGNDDGSAARNVLEAAGLEVGDERQVLEIEIEDRLGETGRILRRSTNAGVNVDLLYLSAAGKLVLGVDDMEKARAA